MGLWIKTAWTQNSPILYVKLVASCCLLQHFILFMPTVVFECIFRICIGVLAWLQPFCTGGELSLANCIRGQPFQTTALHLGEELAWNSSPCSWTPCLRQGWSQTPHPASEGEVQFWMKNGVSRCNPVSSRRNSRWCGDFISTRMRNGNKWKEMFRWLIHLVSFPYAQLFCWI